MKRTILLLMAMMLSTLAGCSGSNEPLNEESMIETEKGSESAKLLETTLEPKMDIIFDELDLPITVLNQTLCVFDYEFEYGRFNALLGINPNNDLTFTVVNLNNNSNAVEVMLEETIDTDVRSIYVHEDYHESYSYFYIKNDNTLWAWGDNSNGILGDNTGVNQEEPVKIMDNVAYIFFDENFTNNTASVWAVKTDKTIWTWGDNDNYAPVLAEDAEDYTIVSGYKIPNSEVAVDCRTVNIDDEPGRRQLHLLYIDTKNNLKLFNGDDDNGETILLAEDVLKFAGRYSGHFIKLDNSLWGYGNNERGQLGDGTKIPFRDEPVKIADNVVFCGSDIYLKSDGEVWAWDEDNPTPEKITDNILSMGYMESFFERDDYYSYLITSDNSLLISDNNPLGELDKLNEPEYVMDYDGDSIITVEPIRRGRLTEYSGYYGWKYKLPNTITFP